MSALPPHLLHIVVICHHILKVEHPFAVKVEVEVGANLAQWHNVPDAQAANTSSQHH